jgi:selenocysteine-specific elongation factor
VDAAAQSLAAAGEAEALAGGRVRLAGRGAALTAAEEDRLARLEAALREGGFATPREDEVPALLGVPAESAEALLGLLVERGVVLRLKDGVVLHASSVEEAKRKIAERIRATGSVAPADLKEMLGATRKYGVPFLEHLDSTGFTVRVGDRRELRAR